MSRNMGYDRGITIFSPDGKLYQIEYAFKAIRLPGDTTIGVRGSDSVCIITTKKVEDKLVDPSSITRVFSITRGIGCVLTGRLPDGIGLIYKARQIAAEFKFDNGYEIPVKHLANEVANYNQLFTQHAYKRVPGVSLMFAAIDDEIGPRLYLVDPAGACYGYKAVASGDKEAEAMSALEKLLKDKKEASKKKDDSGDKKKKSSDDLSSVKLNRRETIMAAIESLQKVLGVDFKSNQVEVATIDQSGRFGLLSEKEIDAFLTAISEQD